MNQTTDFTEAFARLALGQCCVVTRAAEHLGTSTASAEVVLWQQAP
jgi:hypothetical protein